MQMSNLGRIVRLWVFSTLLIALNSHHSKAQDFKIVTKVSQDTLWIKWLPVDYSAMRKLSDEATITRIEVNSADNLQQQDFSGGRITVVPSLKTRFDQLNRQDSVQDRMATLLEPVINPVEKDAENFAFGSVLIENVTQPLFQYELGNILVDTNFDRKKKYAYQIEIENSEPLYVFVDASKTTQFSIPEIDLKIDQKKTVVCAWNLANIRREAFAFDVIHSISNTKNPMPLFEEPYLPFKSEFEENKDFAEIRHENAEKGKVHFYRVIGRDAFGIPALKSEWKEIYVPNIIEAYPIIDSVQADGLNRYVHASIIQSNNAVESYQLFRSKEKDSGYERILKSPLTRDGNHLNYIFPSEVEMETGDAYYYKVALMNQDDTVYSQPFYFFTLDQDPPIAPEGLEIQIDSNGVTNLTWKQLEDDNLLGYRVFRGNSKNEEFVEQTTELSLNTRWTDTLALDNLTNEVYYFVQGVDGNYNQGAHSDTIMGLKPDTIPPVSGIIQKISQVKEGIAIEWIGSTSKDAVSNELFRGEKSLGEVSTLFVDTTVVPGAFYTYRIVTKDLSGNHSESKEVSQKYEPGFRQAPTGTIRADLQNNFIEINYELPDLEIYQVQVYRAKSGENLRRWKTIHDLRETSVQDRSIRIGESYEYQVKYVTRDGIHSLPLELNIGF